MKEADLIGYLSPGVGDLFLSIGPAAAAIMLMIFAQRYVAPQIRLSDEPGMLRAIYAGSYVTAMLLLIAFSAWWILRPGVFQDHIGGDFLEVPSNFIVNPVTGKLYISDSNPGTAYRPAHWRFFTSTFSPNAPNGDGSQPHLVFMFTKISGQGRSGAFYDAPLDIDKDRWKSAVNDDLGYTYEDGPPRLVNVANSKGVIPLRLKNNLGPQDPRIAADAPDRSDGPDDKKATTGERQKQGMLNLISRARAAEHRVATSDELSEIVANLRANSIEARKAGIAALAKVLPTNTKAQHWLIVVLSNEDRDSDPDLQWSLITALRTVVNEWRAAHSDDITPWFDVHPAVKFLTLPVITAIGEAAMDTDSRGIEARRFLKFTPDKRIAKEFEQLDHEWAKSPQDKSCLSNIEITVYYNWAVGAAMTLADSNNQIDDRIFDQVSSMLRLARQAAHGLEGKRDKLQGNESNYGQGFAFAYLATAIGANRFVEPTNPPGKLQQKFLDEAIQGFRAFLAARETQGAEFFDKYYHFPWHRKVATKFLEDQTHSRNSLQLPPNEYRTTQPERSCVGES